MRVRALYIPVLLKSVGRNTALAIALATIEAVKKDSEVVLLVLAADNVIEDVTTFQKSVLGLLLYVQKGMLVPCVLCIVYCVLCIVYCVLCIVATEPATGYSYIKASGEHNEVSKAQEFVEKTNAQLAAGYVENGFLRGSGVFLVHADSDL